MPKLYYPTPDELRNDKPLNELLWFPKYQHQLLKLANTNEGRDLLCLDPWRVRPYPVVMLRKNVAKYYLGRHDGRDWYVSDFRVGAKWGNVARYRWREVQKALDRVILKDLLTLPPLILPDGRVLKPIAGATTTTFFPDPDVESTSVDGELQNSTGNETWATKHDDTVATSASDNGALMSFFVLTADLGTVNWNNMLRSVFLFDTSSLPDGDTIDSATFQFVAAGKGDALYDLSMAFVTSAPASNTALVVGDYDSLGGTRQATDLNVTSVTADNSTYNTMTLNSTGLGNIDKTGVSKFGGRCDADADDSEPATINDDDDAMNVDVRGADEAGTSKDPKLVVLHTTPVTFTPKAIVF